MAKLQNNERNIANTTDNAVEWSNIWRTVWSVLKEPGFIDLAESNSALQKMNWTMQAYHTNTFGV